MTGQLLNFRLHGSPGRNSEPIKRILQGHRAPAWELSTFKSRCKSATSTLRRRERKNKKAVPDGTAFLIPYAQA
jgi:hypothetical protein